MSVGDLNKRRKYVVQRIEQYYGDERSHGNNNNFNLIYDRATVLSFGANIAQVRKSFPFFKEERWKTGNAKNQDNLIEKSGSQHLEIELHGQWDLSIFGFAYFPDKAKDVYYRVLVKLCKIDAGNLEGTPPLLTLRHKSRIQPNGRHVPDQMQRRHGRRRPKIRRRRSVFRFS